MSGDRALADAMLGRLAESVADEGPMQGAVTEVHPDGTLTATVDGAPWRGPYAPPYSPSVGDLCWIRGPSGAKAATDRINRGVAQHVVDARLLVNVTRDLGLLFGGDGRVHVVTAAGVDTDAQARDLYLRKLWTLDLTATGNILAEKNLYAGERLYAVDALLSGFLEAAVARVVGSVTAGSVVVNGPLTLSGLLTGAAANVGVLEADSANLGTQSYAADVRGIDQNLSGNDRAYNQIASYGVYGYNFTTPPPSEAELKENERLVDDGELPPIYDWRYTQPEPYEPERWPWRDDEWHRGPMVGDCPQRMRVATVDGHTSWSERELLVDAVAAIHALRRRVGELERSLAARDEPAARSTTTDRRGSR